MCLNKSYCRCHLIQQAIENDHDKVLKSVFFSPHFCDESYNFLQNAYPLILDNCSLHNNSALQDLTAEFIAVDGQQHVNITHQDVINYMTVYDHFVEGEAEEQEMRLALKRMVKKIEQLCYPNLCDYEGFDAYLQSYAEVKAPDNPSPPIKEKKSPRCTIL